jgi:heterodisulfide reductase subunit C
MKLNKKVNIFKATAVFLIILTAVFYYYEEIKVTEADIETIEVVVAITDIPENTVIEKEMLTIEKRYINDVMKTGNIAKTHDEVVGKRTLVPLYKGELLNTGRIIENKSYMNDKDQTQIAFAINEVDKALMLKEGDYIDIWLEPVSQVQDIQTIIEPHKLIEKIQIIKVRDSNYNNIEKQKVVSVSGDITSDTVYVPAYFTIELPDADLKELYSVEKNKYNIRITCYGAEKLFTTVTNIIGGE